MQSAARPAAFATKKIAGGLTPARATAFVRLEEQTVDSTRSMTPKGHEQTLQRCVVNKKAAN
jgi:hypothetical protein